MRGDPPATEDAPGESSIGEPTPADDPRERLLGLLTRRSLRTGEFTLSSGATENLRHVHAGAGT